MKVGMLSIQRIISLFLFCLAGASLLGEMPSAGNVASLGLAAASGSTGENPCMDLPGSFTSGVPLPGSVKPSASASTDSVSGQGFSLGHGFPPIPAKVVNKIQKWEFINMYELLPNNLELARRSAELQGVPSCTTLKSKKRELSEDWKGLIA